VVMGVAEYRETTASEARTREDETQLYCASAACTTNPTNPTIASLKLLIFSGPAVVLGVGVAPHTYVRHACALRGGVRGGVRDGGRPVARRRSFFRRGRRRRMWGWGRCAVAVGVGSRGRELAVTEVVLEVLEEIFVDRAPCCTSRALIEVW
jgi:hypothetical protein